jgi:hypothetical protein
MKKLLSLAIVAMLATATVTASPVHDKNCKKECCKKNEAKCKEACKKENCTKEECAKACEPKKECCAKPKA